jgi:hypothetical protein
MIDSAQTQYRVIDENRRSTELLSAQMRNQYFTPNKRYGVFVFGMSEDGPTTSLTVYEFTTPS